MGIVLMCALNYTDHLETLSVFSNNATLNFSMFWPQLNALFSQSTNGELTSETILVNLWFIRIIGSDSTYRIVFVRFDCKLLQNRKTVDCSTVVQ